MATNDSSVTESGIVTNAGTTRELARVAVKPPPFWQKDPELWFLQLESQFSLSNITADETKFFTTVAAIDSHVLQAVRDLVLKPPDKEKYEALKKRLISLFADSESARLQQLLQETQLGDMRPSQLLAKMQDLAANNFGDSVLKSLWLNRLPSQTQAILAVSSEPLANLAQMADKIHELATPPTFQVQAVSQDQNSSSIQQQIHMLSQQIANLSAQQQQYTRNPRNQHQRRRSRSSSVHNRWKKKPDMCFYHSKFGDKAIKCIPPCNFKHPEN
jgi:hypothetical protein